MIIRCHTAADVGWHASLSFLLSHYLTTFLFLPLFLYFCASISQPLPVCLSVLLCFLYTNNSLAGYNNLEVAEYLLEHGADVNAQDKGGLIPLHNAASYGVRHTDTHTRSSHTADLSLVHKFSSEMLLLFCLMSVRIYFRVPVVSNTSLNSSTQHWDR